MMGSSSSNLLIILILIQLLLIHTGLITLQYYGILQGKILYSFPLFVLINLVIVFLTFKRIFQAEYQQTELQQTASLIQQMRMQRHDIINHLHTIYALLLMGKTSQIKEYIDDIQLVTANSAQLEKLEEPVLAALLRNKLGRAIAQGISFSIDIRTSISDCRIRPYFLTTICSNLLDNAFEAVSELPDSKRVVDLEIFRAEETYCFAISDSGPGVAEELMDKIFEEGFSTKGSGRGFGLATVKEMVQNLGGTIKVKNHPTTFIIALPPKGR